jgi:hypothetical protein
VDERVILSRVVREEGVRSWDGYKSVLDRVHCWAAVNMVIDFRVP